MLYLHVYAHVRLSNFIVGVVAMVLKGGISTLRVWVVGLVQF